MELEKNYNFIIRYLDFSCHKATAKLFEKDLKYDEILMPTELSKRQKFIKKNIF